MELPGLGQSCSASSCRRLDFLPLKCDACEEVFCKDHITYDQHKCTSAYKKDVQVPVCPLCNTPIPVRRGEMPDVVVGAHMDRDCQYNPAQHKEQIFTNKCLKSGCRRKEMMKLVCDQCHGNFCIKHRHPLDHDCKGGGRPISKAGYAAIMRASKSNVKFTGSSTVSNGSLQHNCDGARNHAPLAPPPTQRSALAGDVTPTRPRPPDPAPRQLSTRREEAGLLCDFLLAAAVIDTAKSNGAPPLACRNQ